MNSLPLPDIVVSQGDFDTLCELVSSAPTSGQRVSEQLDAELARARVVPDVELPADVVAIGTRVVVEELTSDARRIVTVVLPRDANADEGLVSILSPLGCALLGLRPGQVIEWSVPARPLSRFRIAAVLQTPPRARVLPPGAVASGRP